MSDKTVWDILNRNSFFVKNVVKAREAKTQDKFDVYDSESRNLLLECREPDIGLVTKVARLIGGGHDAGTAFNLVANVADSDEQVLRIARGNATLTFGGPAISVSDHWHSLLGKLKKKKIALGTKFSFFPHKQGDPFLLQIKAREIFCNDKSVARISGVNSEYAFSIDPDVPANSQLRQVLLAVGIAQHRIIV